jgi:DUF1365 family protein
MNEGKPIPGSSALYAGTVMHRRIKPRAHRLKYRMFSLLIDLDDCNSLASRLKFFSRNRFNLFSFYDRDFGNKSNEPLRQQIERDLLDAGLEPDGGAIRLFAMPRILGYAFNPLSVYFCYRRTGALLAIVYEVHNTFGQRHSYLIPVNGDAKGLIRQQCAKRLYVSPFMDMDLTYSFKIAQPAERVSFSIVTHDAEGPLMTAVLSAERTELTDMALLRAFVIYPFLTLKVIAGIHWEALLIWFKGMRLRDRPPPPPRPITIVASPSASESMHKDLPVHVLR